MADKRRATITGVGAAGVVDGRRTLDGWMFEGGDYPGMETGSGLVSGWSFDELRAISVLWHAYRFPLPIPGDQFGPVPEP